MSCTGFSVFPLVYVRIHTHAVDTSSPAVQGSSLCQFVFAQKHVCLSSPCVALKLETHTATAIYLSINKRPNSASQTTNSFQREFISRNLSCASLAEQTRRLRIDDGDSESRSDAAARHAQCSCGKSPLLTPASFERQF